jgi:hypothetical protein
MYVCDRNHNWRETDFEIDGSYAVIDFTAEDIAVAFSQTPALQYVLSVVALGVLLVLWQYSDKLPKKRK